MRVFFGLELDATTALRVADWRDRQLACAGQPVPPANFHMTLAFIGPLSEPAMARLCLSVDEWLARGTVCGATLHLNRTGYWPKPGIYWLGPTTWPSHLARLAQKLNSLASAVGAKRDKNPFQPHITLFRRCTAAPPAPSFVPSIMLAYQHCVLFESRQGRQGVSYHVLRDWDLPPATD
jgi:RNA 2',3'-cyclic 3'-phosphodiesterase